jgi:hypothetical protein
MLIGCSNEPAINRLAEIDIMLHEASVPETIYVRDLGDPRIEKLVPHERNENETLLSISVEVENLTGDILWFDSPGTGEGPAIYLWCSFEYRIDSEHGGVGTGASNIRYLDDQAPKQESLFLEPYETKVFILDYIVRSDWEPAKLTVIQDDIGARKSDIIFQELITDKSSLSD